MSKRALRKAMQKANHGSKLTNAEKKLLRRHRKKKKQMQPTSFEVDLPIPKGTLEIHKAIITYIRTYLENTYNEKKWLATKSKTIPFSHSLKPHLSLKRAGHDWLFEVYMKWSQDQVRIKLGIKGYNSGFPISGHELPYDLSDPEFFSKLKQHINRILKAKI